MTEASQESDADETRLPPGTRFGAYEIVRALGAGAFGSVYEARRLPLGNRFALKVLHPELTASSKIVARFMREAEATAKIKHPHVVSTFEVGVFERVPFLAMEFLEGETLHALMQRGRTLPLQLVADIMVPVCSAVATVHEHHLVHRDLKPENIMLTAPRAGALHPIVLDFGVARALTDDSVQITTTARAVGTPLYMSPEQLMDPGAVGARSDQWAIGVILYACLSGDFPFYAKAVPELMIKIASTRPEPLATRLPGVPKDIDALVMRALEREPSARFASVREMGAALLPYASLKVRASWEAEFAPHGAPVVATSGVVPVSKVATAPSPPARGGLRVVVGFAVVAGVVAAVAVALTRAPMATAVPDAEVPRAVPPPVVVAASDVQVAVVAEAPVALDAGAPDVAVVVRRNTRVRPVSPARVGASASSDAATVLVGANGAVMR